MSLMSVYDEKCYHIVQLYLELKSTQEKKTLYMICFTEKLVWRFLNKDKRIIPANSLKLHVYVKMW